MFTNIKISRVIAQWVINSVGFVLITVIFPGVSITHWVTTVISAATIGLLNMLLWPLFMRFALPVTVLTLGLASLVLNGVIIALTAALLPGLEIANFWTAMLVAIGLTIISTAAHHLFIINDDDTFYRNVIKRQSQKKFNKTYSKTPGVLFLQIDGLSYNVFQRAIRDGNLPTLAKWLRSGNYRIESWETDWSSQTGASQAGILMGSNKEIPAFRWYEKESDKNRAFVNPSDLNIIEKRITKHKGLLSEDGASRGNLFSGDAKYTLLTASTIKNPDRKHFGQDYYAYFANPYNFTRTVMMALVDIVRELRAVIDQNQRDVLPRLDHKDKFYWLVRAWTTVIQRDILVQTLISDMYKGRSVMYADFVGYDEVSHHSGIERHESLSILRDIDQQFSRLNQAANDAPRLYQIVILSDHGQTQGATFLQRTGYTLKELIEKLTQKKTIAEANNNEGLSYLHTAVTEASQPKTFTASLLSRITKKFQNSSNHTKISAKQDLHVLSSGCLGLVYFTKIKKRLTLEEINASYPNLIPKLISHPYIGFLLVDSKKHGGIVLGKEGTYVLKNNTINGKNPLEPFGEHAARHIRRTHECPYVADIMINSFYDKTMDEVAAFEELVGSHGGLGGDQSHPFIFFPNQWYYPTKPVISAEQIHKIMKRWIFDIKSSA